MKYYLDTEFHEDGKTIDLISLALVCEDGRELYLVNREAELHRVNDWVRANVLPHLPPYSDKRWRSRREIRDEVMLFVGPHSGVATGPEFWAYYADYDWVVLCQLFGTMMALPEYFPKYCLDLKQLAVLVGNPKLPVQNGTEHDALEDARWNMHVHGLLTSLLPSDAQVKP